MNATTTSHSWGQAFTVTITAVSYILFATTTLLYYVLYPVAWLLAVLWYILASLSSPFVYIGGVIVDITSIPWRIFVSLEALWYFLGSAVLIGISLAFVLHFTLRAFVIVLRLDKKPPPEPIPPKGHDAISYRQARAEKRRQKLEAQEKLAMQARLFASQPLLQEAVREARKTPVTIIGPTSPITPISPVNTFPERPGLLQETILEHSEEDDDDSVF